MREPSIELQAELIKYFRNNVESADLARMVRGLEGERIFDEYVFAYMTGDYEVIQDFCLDFGKLTQIDSIIITPVAIHVYEVKNYDATCHIERGLFYFNNRELYSNPFVQLENIQMRFKGLLNKIGYRGKVHFNVVMVNPNCMVKEGHQIDRLIMRNEIKSHLRSISVSDSSVKRKIFNPSELREKIESQGVYNHHQNDICIDYRKLKSGILCYQCGSLDTRAIHKKIYCLKCGHDFYKSTAIKQVLGELSVLNHKEAITNKQVMNYSGNIARNTTLSRYLNTYLEKVSHLKGNYNSNRMIFNYQPLYDLYTKYIYSK